MCLYKFLNKRANVNVHHTSHSDVVVYEDHRTILNVLFAIKRETECPLPVDIYLFDDHDDAVHPSNEAHKIIADFNNVEPSYREFWNFTEFDIQPLDDDWVTVGMELGLINNVFLFNSTQTSIQFVEEYKTNHHGTKRIYNLGEVWQALSYKGILSDPIKYDEYSVLWTDFGWQWSTKLGKFEFTPRNPFIVDFDLDCFSFHLMGKQMAIPREVLLEKLNERIVSDCHLYYNPTVFIKELIDKSILTTLCFEQGCCGGIYESYKIFNIVDELFFDSQIGK
jgi:hypothetical protein